MIEFTEGTPAVFNDEALVSRITPAIADALGQDKLVPSDRSMGGEDFSRYGLAGVPICMFRLGSVSPERMDEFARRGMTPPSLHSAEYYPEPRQTLRTGLVATVASLLELVGNGQNAR